MGPTWAPIVAGAGFATAVGAAARWALVASRRLGEATGAVERATNDLADAGLAVRAAGRTLGVVADDARTRAARLVK